MVRQVTIDGQNGELIRVEAYEKARKVTYDGREYYFVVNSYSRKEKCDKELLIKYIKEGKTKTELEQIFNLTRLELNNFLNSRFRTVNLEKLLTLI